MRVLRTPHEMRAWALKARAAGHSIGLVPTMGALHAGHLSLMRACRDGNDRAVVSIFVNPTQFAPHEDFDAYPRTWETDSAEAEALDFDAIYAPAASAMYPDGYATYVDVTGISAGLCARTRPHFFRGVATVVTKLFAAVLPDRAYFGEKDAQQLAVVRRLARDLDLGVEVVGCPLVRDADGLALSSRNKYLTPEDRQRALAISRGLDAARAALDAGESDAATLVELVRAAMAGLDIDYVELVDADTMQPLDEARGTIVLAAAAHVGAARLIDNLRYTVAPVAAPALKE